LSAFESSGTRLSNKEISALTKIPKPSVSRLTDTLVKLNFLGQDQETGLYRLGTAALALGVAPKKRHDLASIARPLVAEFGATHGLNVVLGVLDGLEVRATAIDNLSNMPSGLRFSLGASIPVAGTALGHALLVALAEADRNDLCARLRSDGVVECEPIVERAVSAAEEYRSFGYCTVVGEWDGVLTSLAAPLVVPDNDVILAVGCSGPAQLMTDARRHQLAPHFIGLMKKIKSVAQEQFAEWSCDSSTGIGGSELISA
jgi:DNA-binding IclR family transcriptional regulator